MGFLSKLFGEKNSTNFKELVKEGALIIDVRSTDEFNSGHIPGSLNIELGKLNASVVTIKKRNKPVITVCRSGSRSSAAVNMLKAAGVQAYNGGAWNMLKNKIA